MSQLCPAGELKHDPLVLADMPVICALPDNPLLERMLFGPQSLTTLPLRPPICVL